jgi:uncharacterized protein involved in exopolysaccharide biosynthesis
MSDTTISSAEDRTSSPTLRDWLVPIFRHKWTFALTFCGIALGAIFAASVFSSQYEASMEILVNPQRLDPLMTSESTSTQISPHPVTDEDINSEIELLKSPDVLRQVVVATGLKDLATKTLLRYILPGSMLPAHNDAWYIARATKQLSGKLDIKAVTKTNLIQISYKSSDPHRAYEVLQTLGTLYLDKHLAVHRPQGSYAFFTAETQKYRQAMEESERRLADSAKESGIAAPEVQRTELAQQVVTAIGALHTARHNIAADRHRIAELEARMKLTPDRSSTQQVTASAQELLQQLQTNLLAAQLKKTQLAMKYDESYPLVQEANQEIAQTEAAIEAGAKQRYVNQTTDRDPTYELIREDIVKTESDLASQEASAAATERSIDSLQDELVRLDQEARKQADLSRDVKANEANYLLYLSKREQERTSDALDEKRIGNVAIAVPPVLPLIPWLSPLLVLLVGFVLATFVSVGVVFISEYLDPSLRTPMEVVEVLRIPVLASVPKQTA